MVTQSQVADCLPLGLLVFMGRANRLDGETARLLFRMGLAWPWSDAPRHRRCHAQTPGRLRGVDEVNPLGNARIGRILKLAVTRQD